jgi:hypothetical protein
VGATIWWQFSIIRYALSAPVVFCVDWHAKDARQGRPKASQSDRRVALRCDPTPRLPQAYGSTDTVAQGGVLAHPSQDDHIAERQHTPQESDFRIAAVDHDTYSLASGIQLRNYPRDQPRGQLKLGGQGVPASTTRHRKRLLPQNGWARPAQQLPQNDARLIQIVTA